MQREHLELANEERLAICWHMGIKNSTLREAEEVRHIELWLIVYKCGKSDARRGWNKYNNYVKIDMYEKIRNKQEWL